MKKAAILWASLVALAACDSGGGTAGPAGEGCDPAAIEGKVCCDVGDDNLGSFACVDGEWTCDRTVMTDEQAAEQCAGPGPGPGSCIEDALPAQPTLRVPVGTTLWLPSVADDPGCAELWWTQLTPPAPGGALVQRDPEGFGRVVATSAGTWSFRLETGEGSVERSFEVVDVDDTAWQNLNYYPGQSLARVDGEVWVAAVYAPFVLRLDATTLAEVGRIQTGPWPVALAWREGMDVAVVAQRADDTLGFVDVATGRLVDAVWVGDEPANVVVSPDGATAWVALSTERAVAVVDVATRQLIGRVDGIFDPLAMALTPDGKTLLVASHRSSISARSPYADQPEADADDVVAIDTATRAIAARWAAVGSTINGLLVDGDRAYVATTRNVPTLGLGDVSEPTFAHEVVALDLGTGEEVASADLSRQPSSGGFAVSLHGLALAGGDLWVAVEGSDLVLRLDPETLEERERMSAAGRPRALLADGEGVLAHGAQGFTVTRLLAGANPVAAAYSGDRRPADVALGQAYFTGAGATYGANHACNSCHLDGLMDGNVWRTGPFDVWFAARPFFWLDATEPLGWEGYVSSPRMFAFAAGTTIGKNPTTEEALALTSYLRSLVPPPPANGRTARDGSPTAAALRGKELFGGEAGCTACHGGPLATTRVLLADGVTPGTTDVPSLVATYRNGYWLKTGEARSTAAAVDAVAAWAHLDLPAEKRADLTAWVEQLTARDFFLTTAEPRPGSKGVAIDAPLELSLSHPVWQDAANVAHIVLRDGAGVAVPAVVEASGRRVVLTPKEPLTPATSYTVALDGPLEAEDGRALPAGTLLTFETAAAPQLTLGGAYELVVDFPTIDIGAGVLDPSKIIEVRIPVEVAPTGHGGKATLAMTADLSSSVPWVVDGATLRMPAFPVPLGGPAFANGWPTEGGLTDANGDGVADGADGTLEVSGPGFRQGGVAWRLERPKAPVAGCDPTPTGGIALDVTKGTDGRAVIAWEGDAKALGLYVTEPQAKPPLGPGPVTGGVAYWVVQAANFPVGFDGPVVYGELPASGKDASSDSGAPEGGAVLPDGACIKFSVTFGDFTTSTVQLTW